MKNADLAQFWKPPPEGVIFISVDVATNVEEAKVGVECIAQDSRGSVLASEIIAKYAFCLRDGLEEYYYSIGLFGSSLSYSK